MRQQVGEIRITERDLRVGRQVYPLFTIARVQVVPLFVPRGSQRRRVFWLVVLALVTAVLAWWGLLLVACVPALWALLLLPRTVRHAMTPRRYGMFVEAAGIRYATLSAGDPYELRRLAELVRRALREPPETDQVLPVSADVALV
ncbi:DUF6232 family protein [Actinophytocola oryzae]|uniref:Uncharacterized protein n=1 Tax=Actinophytocola oryzae TaxID=502181 RepID=A0A4R7V637_9PSEU|nr:DUF6232 family protein [Actinophytocola oryzae]TDV44943.1 hypothetical protein CLV71_113202 [Actinophytocola oryzae]